jgi:hypothetical protein
MNEEKTIYVVKPSVITVSEIGREHSHWVPDQGFTVITCGHHFVKYSNPTKRDIVTTSIKTIENFELPVYSFRVKTVKKWKFFDDDKWVYKKIDTARGCKITFLNDSTMYVKEVKSEVKKMIEGKLENSSK